MITRFYSLTLIIGVTLAAATVLAQPPVSDEDTIAFLGMNGSPGEPHKCLEIYVVNSVELAGIGSRYEYDSAVIVPVAVDTIGEGSIVVEYELLGRSIGYVGAVAVRSDRPGVLVVNFVPDFFNQARIPAGSGPIIKVYFDVSPTAPLSGSLFMPTDSGPIVNSFATPSGEGILPTLVGTDFNVVPLPYFPGDPDSSGFVNISDVVYLVSYVFQGGPLPMSPNAGDTNGDCVINVLDLVRIIDYLFRGGPPPEIGCVECSY